MRDFYINRFADAGLFEDMSLCLAGRTYMHNAIDVREGE